VRFGTLRGMDERLRQLREELARCKRECDEAKNDARASNVRLNACLIRLGRAEQAIELYEAGQKR
jgi:hypothetical protein